MTKRKDYPGTLSLVVLLAVTFMLAAMLSGCGSLERGESAAKAARATYGAISLVASGDNSTCTLSMGDGALAAADGDGATEQKQSLATRQDPEFAGGDPVTAGINAAAHLGGKAIDAYVGAKGDGSGGECSGGECTGGECTGGECSDGECCTGGECSD